MLRSMYSGISGMKNFQTKLDVIGNNIANVNTFGFKKGRITFKDMMNQTISGANAAQDNRGGKNPIQVGLGSTIATIDTIHTGASLQTTGRSLDLGIDGDGYFIVKQGNAEFYTRAGNMYLDDNGTLVNAEGLKVQAYRNGILEDITVNVNASLPSIKTKTIKLDGALPDLSGSSNLAEGASGQVQQMKIVDTKGAEQTLDYQFIVNSAGTGWDLKFTNQNSEKINKPTVTVPLSYNAATQKFSAGNLNMKTALELDAAETAIVFNLEDLKQEGTSITALANPDGNLEGNLESFNIGSYGQINGVYSNGQIKTLGTIALAKFSNPSGLTKAANNLFQESVNSGTASINTPGDGRGVIAAGSLEMSNVDLSEEFTEMITAQRGFQANTRIITTSDEILQELVNLKR